MLDRDLLKGSVAMVLLVIIYAGNFIATRYSVHNGLSAYDLVALRFGVAGVLLLPYFCRLGWADLGGIGWARGCVLTVIGGSPYLLVFVFGLSLAPAAHGAVLNPGLVPAVVFVIMVILGLKGLVWGQVLSLLVILLGIVVVTAASFEIKGLVLIGDLLLLVTGISWGLFTVLARQWQLRPIQVVAVVSVISMIYLPIYLGFFFDCFDGASMLHVIVQGFYQGIVNSVCTLYLLTYALIKIGTPLTSLFNPLVPVLVTILAIPLLGEVPSTIQGIGILVVVLGMVGAALYERPVKDERL